MAIDTAQKRKAAASVANVATVVGVTPSALTPATWRFVSGWSYFVDVSVAATVTVISLPGDGYAIPTNLADGYALATQSTDRYRG